MDQGSQRRIIRSSIERNGVIRNSRARKRFGQHFLVDQDAIERIHAGLSIGASDSVIEIGPGRGALTEGLAKATSILTCIELDRDLSVEIKARFPDVSVISQDVLTVPLARFAQTRVVGNLPYNISTPLLMYLFDQPNLIDMHFMLQKEVADRLTANPGTKQWGRLSVMAQYRWQIDPLMDVPASSFVPAPKVESTFLRFLPINFEPQADDLTQFQSVVRSAFSKRRKTIENSLSEFQIPWSNISVNPRLRADQVSVATYVALANHAST